MQFVPGKLIVFEGLDATGKTTQSQLLAGQLGRRQVRPMPLFEHQPSGAGVIGNKIYAITEQEEMHGFTRQFLHLASHTEHYQNKIIPALAERSVVLDRCWWSTVAYGFFGGHLDQHTNWVDFINMAKMPTLGHAPSIVFLFNKPYKQDGNNTNAVEQGYAALCDYSAGMIGGGPTIMVVPGGAPDWVNLWIFDRLCECGYILQDDGHTVPTSSAVTDHFVASQTVEDIGVDPAREAQDRFEDYEADD